MGTLTLTTRGDSFALGWFEPTEMGRPGTDGEPTCRGTYAMQSGVIQIEWRNLACNGAITFVWKPIRRGFRLIIVRAGIGDRALFEGDSGGSPLERSLSTSTRGVWPPSGTPRQISVPVPMSRRTC